MCAHVPKYRTRYLKGVLIESIMSTTTINKKIKSIRYNESENNTKYNER